MPLSISSSNQRIPPAPYGKLWLLVLLLVVVLGSGMEMFLRRSGHLKSVANDKVLWGMQLDKIRNNEVDVALLGASRMQCGLQVDRFEEKSGHSAANVTIDGSSPIPVLRYIAEETGFSGLVVVSLTAKHILNDNRLAQSVPWLQWYKSSFLGPEKYNPVFNKRILNFLQSRLVLFSENCGIRLIRKKDPIPFRTMPSRSIRAYYRECLSDEGLEMATQKQFARRARRPAGWTDEKMKHEWRLRILNIAQYVEMIRKRGGKTVFVRFPNTGRYGAVFDEVYPRSVYWDSLGSLTGAETIYFKDDPKLAALVCAEGSHLNYDDSLIMTDELVELLFRKKTEEQAQAGL